MVSVNMKNIAGASGGGEDKRLKKNCEYILIYAKNYENLTSFKNVYEYIDMYNEYMNYKAQKRIGIIAVLLLIKVIKYILVQQKMVME